MSLPAPRAVASRGRYKRPFDLVLLVSAHIALLPLWVVLWTLIPLLIWLSDRGPLFHRQLRAGEGGKPFTLRKFRTMVRDAELIGPAWTTEDDPRFTRFGRVLRRTALDELPSLLNVWKGEMSFVGPRALNVDEQALLERQIPGFNERLVVRPGLTGLAQVYNLSDDPELKLRYDLAYIRGMSLWLDVKLIVLSARNTLFARWDRRKGKAGQGRDSSTS